MTLNFEFEFAHTERPIVPVRFTNILDRLSIVTEALLDTGAEVSLMDQELAGTLSLDLSDFGPERQRTIVGIGGVVSGIQWVSVAVTLLNFPDERTVELRMAALPGLGKTVGSLLGRDFFQDFDFGLTHRRRLLYLGQAGAPGG